MQKTPPKSDFVKKLCNLNFFYTLSYAKIRRLKKFSFLSIPEEEGMEKERKKGGEKICIYVKTTASFASVHHHVWRTQAAWTNKLHVDMLYVNQ